jgi:DNA-binding CsgD family transcriptional regulator
VSVTFSPADLKRMESAAEALLTPLAHERVDDWRRTVMRTIKRALDGDGAMFTLVPSIEPGADATFSEDGLEFQWRLAPPPANKLVFDEEQFAGMQAACRSNEGLGVVLVTRDRGGVHPFGEKALAMLRLLQPALAVGIEMRQRFARRRAEFFRVLDAMREGLMLVEASGRVLHETPAIARLLADEWERDRVRTAMLACARSLSEARRAYGGEVRTAQHRYRIRGCYAGEELAGSSTVLVAVERVGPVPVPDDTALKLKFGLTPREIQVTWLLAAGRRNDDVAASLQISPHTARRHTERVLAKLGASSRAAVGALLRGT